MPADEGARPGARAGLEEERQHAAVPVRRGEHDCGRAIYIGHVERAWPLLRAEEQRDEERDAGFVAAARRAVQRICRIE